MWGIHRSPVNSPHKGQWRGALIFSLICARIKGWVNNREAGDLRRHRAHNDATLMFWKTMTCQSFIQRYQYHCSDIPGDTRGQGTSSNNIYLVISEYTSFKIGTFNIQGFVCTINIQPAYLTNICSNNVFMLEGCILLLYVNLDAVKTTLRTSYNGVHGATNIVYSTEMTNEPTNKISLGHFQWLIIWRKITVSYRYSAIWLLTNILAHQRIDYSSPVRARSGV